MNNVTSNNVISTINCVIKKSLSSDIEVYNATLDEGRQTHTDRLYSKS